MFSKIKIDLILPMIKSFDRHCVYHWPNGDYILCQWRSIHVDEWNSNALPHDF